MIFAEEKEHRVFTFPNHVNCIYFLIKNNDVVYVGQTRNGLCRPFSHYDKDFDEVKLICCDEKDLDFMEDSYIKKYKPFYNKQRNYAAVWSLQKVKNSIRMRTDMKDYTLTKLKKLLRELNIVPEKDCYTGKYLITFEEYQKVINFLVG